ncbi:hypothetical protein [Halobacterium noricense]|nr:hypothetical protein [Halobacterium noricense]
MLDVACGAVSTAKVRELLVVGAVCVRERRADDRHVLAAVG